MFSAILHNAIPNEILPVLVPLAILLGAAALWLARARNLPAVPALLWGLSMGVELAATLTPTLDHGRSSPTCAIGGSGMWDAAFSLTEGGLNIAMYVPLGFFGVLTFGRPLTNIAAYVNLTVATEIAQGVTRDGRTCDGADMIDNSLGAVIGVLLALAWLSAVDHWPKITKRDAVLGSTILGGGLLLLGVILANTLQIVSLDSQGNGAAPSPAFIANRMASQLFGPGVHVSGVSQDKSMKINQNQQYYSTSTDLGSFTFQWPMIRLVSFESSDHLAESGSLSDEELRAKGVQFISQWFYGVADGATQTFNPIGSGSARALSYRRYKDGVLMPMRLDLAITTAGRVLSATAVPIADPADFPKPTVSIDEAKKIAVISHPEAHAENAFLLAKKIGGDWHPCWAVNLTGQSSASPGVFVDAVTGVAVTPEQ